MVNSREKDSAKILHWRLVGFETNSASNFRHDLEYLLIYHNLLINQLFLPMVMSVLKNLVVDLDLNQRQFKVPSFLFLNVFLSFPVYLHIRS